MAPRPLPQSWPSPSPRPTIAHYNGTLRWHPATAPRPLHPAMAPWCHVQCAKVVRRPPPLLEVRTPIAIAIWGISGTFQQAASIAKKKQSTLPKIATGLWKIRLLDWSLFQIIQQGGCPTSYVSLPESSVCCGELLGTKIAWYCCKNIGFKYFILISILYIHLQIFIYIYIYIYIYLFISLLSFDFLAAEWNSFTLWH